MKRKILLATVAIVIVIASALIGYYLESRPGSGLPLTYDFSNAVSGDFLGWNTSGDVFNNETNGVTIHPGGILSRQFKALSSEVSVSFNWTYDAVMVISRQLGGIYQDLAYPYSSSSEDMGTLYTNATSFGIDNSTAFTVRFEASGYRITFVYSVKLWDSAAFS